MRVGIAGLGAAGLAFLPALRRHPGFDAVALAEPDPALRAHAQSQTGAAGYAGLGELLAHPGLDALILATPTPLHAAQAQRAAAAGLHVLCEKPMATTLEQARAMVEAAERAGVVLQVGHSHSFDAPIREMRALIASGALGPLRMINSWCFSDWVQRPRRVEELDPAQGGGVTFRQGAHQFDILRLLGGGLASSVRARCFDWNAQQRTVGAHTVFIDFEQAGVSATAVYNGYGGLDSAELCFGIGEWGLRKPPRAVAPAGGDALSAQDALRAKQQRARGAIADAAPHQPFFGLTIASCEGGDIRQTPKGLLVSTAAGERRIELPLTPNPRDLVLDEWHGAIRAGVPPLHNGRWGLATLEVCIAALASSRSGREVRLREQVAVPA